jgi:hypothetical protein
MENEEYCCCCAEKVKIDEKAPAFELPAYNPKTDSEEKISLESLK